MLHFPMRTEFNELAYSHTLVSYTQDSMSDILHVAFSCADLRVLYANADTVVYRFVRTEVNWLRDALANHVSWEAKRHQARK